MDSLKNIRFLTWCIAQVMGVMLSLYTFFVWAPWLGAHSHEQAVALYGAEKIPDCDAIAVNHGQFSCMPWGSVAENPWGFALCTVLLVSGIGFVAITRAAGKGLFSPEFGGALGSRINAVLSRFDLPELELSRVRYFIHFGLALLVVASVPLVSRLISLLT